MALVLRNSASAVSGFWTMFRLAWTWRRDSQDLLARTLPALILSSVCFCLFTVAAGFSSSISSGVGNEVLLDGQGCGVIYTGSSTPETVSALHGYVSQTINNAANYAQECYSSNATGNFDCTNFIKDHLPGTMDDQAACPFQDGMCRSNQSNLLLDSGYLDSREHFGLNTPDNQRIFFRTTMHCAPVNTEGFSRNISTPVNNYTQYFYGPYVEDTDFTWQTEDLGAQYRRASGTKLDSWAADLSLSVMYANTANKTTRPVFSSFVPDPRLFRSDADLNLIFLSGNGVAFWEPTNDPWYRASIPWVQTRPVGYNITDEWSKTVYRPDEAASPMGCIQQYQYCNAESKCGELASFYDAIATAAQYFDMPLEVISGYANATGPAASQFTWFELIIYSAYDLMSLLTDLGATSLLSRRNFEMGFMGQIPIDQWKLDVTHWWTTLLSAKQAAFVNAAHGTSDPLLLQNMMSPEDVQMGHLCRNQKIRSTNHTSFSLFGLYFTFTLGVLIILVSYLLEPIFEYLARRRKYEEYKYLEWTGNETLQLQRMAYQGLGSEAWSGYTDSVPKTRPGYFLADLHAGYSIDLSKKFESAMKESTKRAATQVRHLPADPMADRPESITGTDGIESINNIRTSSSSDDIVLPEVVSPTDVSLLEISPRLMSAELISVEPISPIRQTSGPGESQMAAQPVLGSRL